MCHLLLAVPVLALGVFWIWPLAIAAPVYAVAAGLSGALYLKMLQAMKRPAAAGLEELGHSVGEVVSVAGDDLHVLVHGEPWSARSPDALAVGDRVRVTSVDGMTLTVRRSGPGFHPPSSSPHAAATDPSPPLRNR